MRVNRRLCKSLFRIATDFGRPIGGIRPRRIANWLAAEGFGELEESEWRWCNDYLGHKMYLNPFYTIDAQVIAFGMYDSRLQAAIRRFTPRGGTCVDVGANIGTTALPMAYFSGDQGRVVAFEPHPMLHSRLQRHVEANEMARFVEVRSEALSDRNGDCKLAAVEQSARNHGQSFVVQNRSVSGCSVPTRTLDGIIAELGIDHVSLVKMDVQGSETMVLRGGADVLSRCRPLLLTEVSSCDLEQAGTSAKEMLGIIEMYGYNIYRISKKGERSTRISSQESFVNPLSCVLCIPT